MKKVYNFSAGPSMLPNEVLARAREELTNYCGTGMSVMEIAPGSEEFEKIISEATELLRSLLSIPPSYKIFFVGGGAEAQYSAVPLNLMSDHKCADYVITGQSAKSAELEAKKYGDIAIAATSAGATTPYSTIPDMKRSHFRPDADYVHITYASRIYGTKYNYIPDTGSIPLVADMSAFLLSEPIDISKFTLVYAGVEENIAPSGMTIVIVRDEYVGRARRDTPNTLNYKWIKENGTSTSSEPIWNIYMAKLVFEWIKSVGGLEQIKRRNERKASLLYDYLDSQSYYTAPVDKKCRSMMNVVFVTGDSALDRKFAKEAREEGLVNLEGHSSIGGMRASIYNAMPYEGVERLVDFMRRFAQENPKLDG